MIIGREKEDEMEESIKGCPYCGVTGVVHSNGGGCYSVRCPICEAGGPVSWTESNAIHRWNDMVDIRKKWRADDD